jgi:endonuclease III
MKALDREDFFARLKAENPHPKTELEYSSSFELLIAVLLSAQATDKGVNLATRKLFKAANSPSKMLELGHDRVVEHIKTIGLFRSKAKHVMETCQILVDQHQGQIPEDRAALEGMPGVGRKTANVVLNTAFGWPTMAVDTHIFRVGNRTGLGKGKTPLAVETQLLKRVPKTYMLHAHHWLILHGRYICKARSPDCWRCPVADLCSFRPKTKHPQDR